MADPQKNDIKDNGVNSTTTNITQNTIDTDNTAGTYTTNGVNRSNAANRNNQRANNGNHNGKVEGRKIRPLRPLERVRPRYAHDLLQQRPQAVTEEQKKVEAQQRAKDIREYENAILYSDYYYDDTFEYRHVTLPKKLIQWIPIFGPKYGLLTEAEWRGLGVKMSRGWEHYMVYQPEPHILLFRREKDYQKKYGNEDISNKVSAQPEEEKEAVKESKKESEKLPDKEVQKEAEKEEQKEAEKEEKKA
ncbi:regulatory subunit of cyclin-dependent kinase [Pilobolus umbonatus]|nr:regulatory subunit of cyclin-dependent kinase [Pilobolus umbonatus]